jgi:hypothetical protein
MAMSIIEDPTPLVRTNIANNVTRRRLIGSAAGLAAATLATVGLVSAQTSTATPDASTSSSSSTTTTGTAGDDQLTTFLASVKTDRDAVASSIDTTMIDQILAVANDLQTQSTTASDTDSPPVPSTSSDSTTSSATPAASSSGTSATTVAPGKRQLLAAAQSSGRAARQLIVAELSAYGLPSQKVDASHSLADVYDRIKTAGTDVSGSSIADAMTLVTYAQQLYADAYDKYGAGTYAQAQGTGRAAGGLASAAETLLGKNGFGGAGSGGMSVNGNQGGGANQKKPTSGSSSNSNGDNSSAPGDGDSSTPATVPTPSF